MITETNKILAAELHDMVGDYIDLTAKQTDAILVISRVMDTDVSPDNYAHRGRVLGTPQNIELALEQGCAISPELTQAIVNIGIRVAAKMMAPAQLASLIQSAYKNP